MPTLTILSIILWPLTFLSVDKWKALYLKANFPKYVHKSQMHMQTKVYSYNILYSAVYTLLDGFPYDFMFSNAISKIMVMQNKFTNPSLQ